MLKVFIASLNSVYILYKCVCQYESICSACVVIAAVHAAHGSLCGVRGRPCDGVLPSIIMVASSQVNIFSLETSVGS